MTNCFDKVRLQQLIADTSHVENLAANVFHLFLVKQQELKTEMKTAALLPVDEAKEAIQDLIYEFRVQDAETVKSLGELFDVHCLDPNGFTYHAFISLLLLLIKKILNMREGVVSAGGMESYSVPYPVRVVSRCASPVPQASPEGTRSVPPPVSDFPRDPYHSPLSGRRVIRTSTYTTGPVRSAASPSRRLGNRFAHINLLPLTLTPRATQRHQPGLSPRSGQQPVSRLSQIVPPLSRAHAIPKQDRTYYYRVPTGNQIASGTQSKDSKQHYSSKDSQPTSNSMMAPNFVAPNEQISSDRLVELSKNCGPGAAEVGEFKNMMHTYNVRHSMEGNQQFREDLNSIRKQTTHIQNSIHDTNRYTSHHHHPHRVVLH